MNTIKTKAFSDRNLTEEETHKVETYLTRVCPWVSCKVSLEGILQVTAQHEKLKDREGLVLAADAVFCMARLWWLYEK